MSARLLERERCANHSAREAVARCPECRRSLCRECATEHGGRVICSICVAKTAKSARGHTLGRWPVRVACVAGGLLVGWVFFHIGAQIILSTPASFHESSLWAAPWLEAE